MDIDRVRNALTGRSYLKRIGRENLNGTSSGAPKTKRKGQPPITLRLIEEWPVVVAGYVSANPAVSNERGNPLPDRHRTQRACVR
jgi:hypothetical protein